MEDAPSNFFRSFWTTTVLERVSYTWNVIGSSASELYRASVKDAHRGWDQAGTAKQRLSTRSSTTKRVFHVLRSGQMFDHEIGGVKTPRRIIDKQHGPECGYEANENVIQLVHPFGNGVSEELKQRAEFYKFNETLGGQPVLHPRGYRRLLSDYGIASTWSRFDPDHLVKALRENRVAIAIVDPAILDPTRYLPKPELHAIVVTNFGVNAQHTVVRYTGMDSNFGGTESHWLRDRFYNAVAASGFKILITDTCIAQQYWETYHVLTRVVGGIRVSSSATP